MQNDRLHILQNQDGNMDWLRRGLRVEDISPRSTILRSINPGKYRIVLQENIIDDKWLPISLDEIKDEMKDRPVVDASVNLQQRLYCAVVTIEGATALYQTRRCRRQEEGKDQDDEVYISFFPIDRAGSVQDTNDRGDIGKDNIIIDLNQKLRMVLLQNHVNSKSNEELMSDPLKVIIGAKRRNQFYREFKAHTVYM